MNGTESLVRGARRGCEIKTRAGSALLAQIRGQLLVINLRSETNPFRIRKSEKRCEQRIWAGTRGPRIADRALFGSG